MSMRSIGTSLSLMLWLVIATSALAKSDNPPVLDTQGNPLEPGKDYYIKPAITDVGGRATLLSRNNPCPLYVGQENSDAAEGLPLFFTPFAEEDDVVKVNRDFKVTFSAASICVQGTNWNLAEKDSESGRRLIAASGRDDYFRITETPIKGSYYIGWCPTDVCPFCRFDCGIVGGLRENGKILLALDGNVLPVVFEKAY
ncbi:alpha-amylase/subtilisin inhibitor-like [Glycine soja]|uniref:Alpha-amylase/subtilisin inhibitor n=1 Tax=Glycine soja TaxID=3848 RepID=A0A0B2QHS2_GLYSO|nr:alpha-amylase/subtilisin inhibitor-like [Glycine soja]KHN19473.1 Alpha-amylase/subtilisin inhibitor [Glycine soja]RZB77313.1 Alpha-amylase/subtilisin inhibitor [Glycine soja]